MKVENIKRHNSDYDAYIFGTSRSNFYDTDLASKLSGLRYYNFASASERLNRIYQKLLWIKREGILVKQVILALDFDFMFLMDDLPENALASNEHPLVSNTSYVNFYLPYFLKFDWNNWRKFFTYNFIDVKPITYKYVNKSGHWYFVDKDKLIEEDHDNYLKTVFSDKIPYERGDNRIQVNLDRLNVIIEHLKKESIPYVVTINPIHHSSFKSFDENEYALWKKSVIGICGSVWDFSGLNSVTENDRLYYESSHFRWLVGDMVLRRIFNSPLGGSFQEDFGKLISNDIKQASVKDGR